MDMNTNNLPEIMEVVKVHSELRVKIYFKGAPLLLPNWFRQGCLCKLAKKKHVNKLSHIKTQTENASSIFGELRLQKTNVMYPPSIIRFSLLLRYTSVQSYKVLLVELTLPSLSFLRRISNDLSFLKVLKNEGNAA